MKIWKKKLSFLFFFFFALFFFSTILFVPNASAITLTLGVTPTGTEYANPEVQCSGPAYDAPFTDATIGNKTYCQIDPPTNVSDGFELRGIRTKNTYAVEEGKLYTIYLEIRNNSGTIGNSKPMLWTVQPFPSDYFALVGLSTEYTQVGLTRSDDAIAADYDEWYADMYAITVKALKSGTTRFQLGNTTQILVTSRIVSAQYSPTYKFQVRMNRIVEYDQDSISALRQDTQAQTEEIQQGNEEAQDRWEADKQEEADREEALNDDSEEMGSLFSFNITNPFTAFLALFTDGGSCVSIPIIAGMVHSQQTTYCPWFSATTRNILTPVITLVASVILVGFVVGWLNGNDSNGSITIKGGLKGK